MGVTNWELSTDTDLMGEVARGSEEKSELAFEELIKRHNHFVRGRCHKALQNWDLADEATQEIFLKLYLNAVVYCPDRSAFRTWLWSLTSHHCSHALRARNNIRRKHPEIDTSVVMQQIAYDDPLKTLRLQELGERIRCALKYLKSIDPDACQALEIVLYSDLVGEAAAKHVGVTKTSFRVRVSRGYATLREILADYEDLAGRDKEKVRNRSRSGRDPDLNEVNQPLRGQENNHDEPGTEGREDAQGTAGDVAGGPEYPEPGQESS